MASLNHIVLLGMLIRAPSFRQTTRNTPICTFDLQVETGHREQDCVIRIIIFGKQAEPAARYLGGGSTVFVSGHLRQWERVDREGQKVRSLEVVAERIEFLSEPASYAKEIKRSFIDPPAVVADADPPHSSRKRHI